MMFSRALVNQISSGPDLKKQLSLKSELSSLLPFLRQSMPKSSALSPSAIRIHGLHRNHVSTGTIISYPDGRESLSAGVSLSPSTSEPQTSPFCSSHSTESEPLNTHETVSQSWSNALDGLQSHWEHTAITHTAWSPVILYQLRPRSHSQISFITLPQTAEHDPA